MSIDRTLTSSVSTVQTRETSDTPVQKRVREKRPPRRRQRNVKRLREASCSRASDITAKRVEALKRLSVTVKAVRIRRKIETRSFARRRATTESK